MLNDGIGESHGDKLAGFIGWLFRSRALLWIEMVDGAVCIVGHSRIV